MSISEIHTSEIWANNLSQTKAKESFSASFPVNRFRFCNRCGSLDVFITLQDSDLLGKCLDCHSRWKEKSS